MKKVQEASPLAREITFLVIIVFSILSLLSLFDLCGAGGKLLSGLLFGLFGAVSYIFQSAFWWQVDYLYPTRTIPS